MSWSGKPLAPVTRWLYGLAVLTFCLIVFGGFVRLSRAGLSIVEWKPVAGVLPPIGDEAWRAEFAKYQQTPEYRAINFDMSVDGYRRIFYIEWGHRLVARLAGLVVILPLAVFLRRGAIAPRHAGPFAGIAALFGLQAFLGWFMVRSGLFDAPAVSHYRLTVHLMMAMALLAVTTWMAMDRDGRVPPPVRRLGTTQVSRAALLLIAVLSIQIGYGALVAGLKAGHVSYSWPWMGGTFVPAGTFGATESIWTTLTASPAGVHWVHRWFAAVVLAVTIWLVAASRRADATRTVRRWAVVVALLVGVQIALGVSVLWLHVPVSLALLHQAVGLSTFAAALVVNHRALR